MVESLATGQHALYRVIISYHLIESGRVILNVYSLSGDRLTTLLQEYQESGPHRVALDFSCLKPGLYICEMGTDTERMTQKMIVLP